MYRKKKNALIFPFAFLILSISATAMAVECVNVAGRWLPHAEFTTWCEPDYRPEHHSIDRIYFVQQTGCAIYGSGTTITIFDGRPVRTEEYNLWGTVSNNLVNWRVEAVSVNYSRISVASGRLSDGYIEGTTSSDTITGSTHCRHEGTVRILIEPYEVPSTMPVLQGVVRDASTGGPIAGAAVSLSPSQLPSTTTDLDGSFSFADLPPGTYTVTASARNHRDVSQQVTIVSGQTRIVSLSLELTSPSVSASVSPSSASHGQNVTLTARVSDPDGIDDIVSVSADLSPIGLCVDRALTFSNFTWSVTFAVPASSPVGQRALRVTARDSSGAVAYDDASLAILAQFSGTVTADRPETQTFENRIPGQRLIFDLGSTGGSRMLRQACTAQLNVRGPDGSAYGPYNLTAGGQAVIENAPAGTWITEVRTTCTEPVSYSFRTRGSGTGLVVGMVRNRLGRLLSGINITSDTGGASLSVNGYFLMILPAGVHTLTGNSGFILPNSSNATIEAGSATEVSMEVHQVKPSIWLELDKTSYSARETPELKITMYRGTSENTVDLYLVLGGPDGRFYQYGSWGEVTGPTVPSFDVMDIENFEAPGSPVTESTAPGTWTYYGAFARPGTVELVGDICPASLQIIQ